jgi:diguanylate cyclase (GGDEF)-like protein
MPDTSHGKTAQPGGAHRARPLAVWLLTGMIGSAVLVLLAGPLADDVPPQHAAQLAWWLLAPLFAVAEIAVVHIRFRRDSHTLGLGEVVLVLGLFFADPRGLVLAQVVGAAVALVLHRRQRSALKLFFNLGQFALSACIALLVFHALAPAAADGLRAWGAAFAATATADIVSLLVVTSAMSIAQGTVERSGLPFAFGFGAVSAAANTTLALLPVVLLVHEPPALWLLATPVAALILAYRGHTREHQRATRMLALHDAIRITQGSLAVEDSVTALLDQARTMLRANVAELVLLPRIAGDPVLRTRRGSAAAGDVMQADGLSPSEADLIERLGDRPSLLLRRSRRRASTAHPYLLERHAREAMVAALPGERSLLGLLVVADPAHDVAAFNDDDLVFLETFANHATVTLQNGRLAEALMRVTELGTRLNEAKLHDPLTGLPNRALFADRVAQALARRSRAVGVALIMLDIERFALVNDAVGHGGGDRVLTVCAERLTRCLHPDDTAARVGGDEFAVLVESVDDEREAVDLARRLVTELGRPLVVQNIEFRLVARAGVALPYDSIDGDEIVRNVELADQLAKQTGACEPVVFDRDVHLELAERQTLLADLQVAMSRGELLAHFQPIVSLTSGRVEMLETLARWNHPKRGLLSAPSFIPLAEEAGLMVGVGEAMLAQACACTAACRASSPALAHLAVTVNLSANELADDSLIERVVSALDHSGLDPRALVLEVTETVVMGDADATLDRLRRLEALGVRLAVDDFGTGYSSLEYLRRFPFHVLKIPKPFIDDIAAAPDDTAFVRTMLTLADLMGLQVVAEGIETSAQAATLRRLGCTLGQGFLFSRPLDIEAVMRFLAAGAWQFDVAA